MVRVAECLARADHRGAAAHLSAYVRANPDQPLFRLQLADLCARAALPAEAKVHYERFVADAEDGPPALRPHLVTAHIKLMGLAQARGDTFAEALHRGAGLLQLVKDQDGTADRDPAFCEEMLCKALKALTEAKELRPGDPRPRAALAQVYERAGSAGGARAERAALRADPVPGARKPVLAD
jgi:Flp pilus assembly protein TadD